MSRLDTVKEKYPQINWDVFKTFDPSKNGKYLEWLGQEYTGPKTKSNVEKVGSELKDLIEKFERRKDSLKEKDIFKYTAKTLAAELETLKPSNKETKEQGVVDLGDVAGARVVMLENFEAAKKYCAGTKWCISNSQHFYRYCKDNNIFVAIRNNVKLALVIPLTKGYQKLYYTIYDETDRSYGRDDFNFNLKQDTRISNFRSRSDDPIKAVLDKCVEFSEKTKNCFSSLDFRVISKENVLKVFDALKIKEHSKENENLINGLVAGSTACKLFRFLKENASAKELAPVIEFYKKTTRKMSIYFDKTTKKYYFYEEGLPDTYYRDCTKFFSKNFTFSDFLNIEKAMKKMPQFKLTLADKVNQIGGITKALKDPTLAKEITKQIEKNATKKPAAKKVAPKRAVKKTA